MWAKREKAGDGAKGCRWSGFKAESGAWRLGEGRWGQGGGVPLGPAGGGGGVSGRGMYPLETWQMPLTSGMPILQASGMPCPSSADTGPAMGQRDAQQLRNGRINTNGCRSGRFGGLRPWVCHLRGPRR